MATDVKCPVCGSKTTLRTSKKGPNIGKQFIVCERYPECKFKVRYAEAGIDIGTRNKLALAIWRMGVQPRKNDNIYVMLIFDPQASFSLRMIYLEPSVVTAKEATCQSFSFVDPLVSAVSQPPKPALGEVLRQLNPIDFLNPKMIPMSAIKPNRRDSVVCLCLEFQEDTTKIGVILDNDRTAIASTSRINAGSIAKLYTNVCETFIAEKSLSRTDHDALISLIDLINSMNLIRENLRISPNHEDSHNEMGVIYGNQGKFDDAEREFKEALRINPNNADAHNNLGAIYHKQGKFDASVREYKEALRIDPNLVLAHMNLGILYSEQGKFDDAVYECKETLRLAPDFAEAHYTLGLVYCKQRRIDDAEREYKEALRINPNYTDSHNNLGGLYATQGKFDDAEREYKEALRIAPNFAGAYNNLGKLYYMQGKFDDAEQEYKGALRIDPNFAHAHYGLGILYSKQGKIDDAEREFKEVIRIDPNDTDTKNKLADVLKKR
jgi:tetratricopeptide (TPR) repeat protein